MYTFSFDDIDTSWFKVQIVMTLRYLHSPYNNNACIENEVIEKKLRYNNVLEISSPVDRK